MPPMRITPGIVGLVVAVALVAQQPRRDAAALSKALAADKAFDVAWAAHHARELGDKNLAKYLQQALAKWQQHEDLDAPVVRLHILDALIAIGPRMPASDIVPLVDDATCGVAAFTLIAREPSHNEADLLALFRRDWPVDGQKHLKTLPPRLNAIGLLLVAQRTPGFAALLAEGADFDLDLVVGDGAAVSRESWEVGLADWKHPARDWPPYPNFRFHDPVRIGGAKWECVSMPRPIASSILRYSEATAPQTQRVFSFSISPDNMQKATWPGVDWLCTLALMAPANREQTLVFNPESFVTAAIAARAVRQKLVDTLGERLLANGALAAEDAKVFARKVQVHLIDRRSDQSTPLPAIPPAQ